jgi:hypothetical protein
MSQIYRFKINLNQILFLLFGDCLNLRVCEQSKIGSDSVKLFPVEKHVN